MSRIETAYAALFAQLGTVPGIVTKSRVLRHWSDVPAIQQPALFQAQGRQSTLSTNDNLPTRWMYHAHIYLYVYGDQQNGGVPSTTLNTLIDAVKDALAPSPATGKQTLGGVVEHCRIAGEIETDDGVLGDQAIAIIPIEMQPLF